MKGKTYSTSIGTIKVIKIDGDNVTILRNGIVSHMSANYLRHILELD